MLAQRLVRKVCGDCVEERPPDPQETEFLKPGGDSADIPALTHGRGCSNCRDTGYRGRVGIFELLAVDDPVRKRIQERANASEIRDTALERGMHLLRDDGVAKILRGMTTVEEVSRVTVRAAM